VSIPPSAKDEDVTMKGAEAALPPVIIAPNAAKATLAAKKNRESPVFIALAPSAPFEPN